MLKFVRPYPNKLKIELVRRSHPKAIGKRVAKSAVGRILGNKLVASCRSSKAATEENRIVITIVPTSQRVFIMGLYTERHNDRLRKPHLLLLPARTLGTRHIPSMPGSKDGALAHHVQDSTQSSKMSITMSIISKAIGP